MLHTLRRSVLQAFTSLGGPVAPPGRQVAAAWVVLVVIVPIVLLPTGVRHLQLYEQGWRPEAAGLLALSWWGFFAAVAVGLAGVLLSRGVGPVGRGATLLVVCGLVLSNETSMLALGSLTCWGLLYVSIMIAAYRVFLDYQAGLLCTMLGMVALVAGAVAELTGWMPLAPYAAAPIHHPLYDIDGSGTLAVAMAASTLPVCFALVNYGMNQALILHRYITESVLARFLPPAMVQRAARGELTLDDAPERRVVTVVFTDVVGFTALSEQLGAARVGEVLNAYLTQVAEVAYAHGATIDKFVGDAAMLVYGAPERMTPEEQAQRAVALARALIATAASLGGDRTLQIRAGIHTGEAVVGNFGSPHRSDYTVIGPAVNLASRLESACSPGRILVSAHTAALLGEQATTAAVGPLKLKGIAEPVTAYFVT
ncbi:MAG: adenylate/guanylate cyclase domain-containing protein [Deltaproteobacteria bacterium]|jgi:class 3 adenylate cyclase|nr:adenylate/guanylate cyclase domain-containing protein [Deltaproteobacteria bacterium]MBW2537128.1 adenylate/guanylate cyclase domain-containing protein [Deltaproteobacteria bacterium]